ncbi:MAG: hypothetical protein ACTHXX_10230 [Staphylococcus equorum]
MLTLLTKKAEDFLLKLRIELLFRGKNEDEVNAIEEELRDHITIAEENNDNINNLLNTPIKDYADNFSKELSLTKGINKYILYIISFMIVMTTVPRMLDNSFQLSLSLIFYILFIFIGSFVLVLFVVKKVIMRWGDSKKTYVAAFVIASVIFGIYLLCEFVLRNNPLFVFWSPNQTTNFIMGLILLLITTITCFVIKQKYFAFLILILCLPDLIGKIFTGGDHTNYNFVLITSIGTIILLWSVSIYIFFKYWREKKEKSH